MVNEFEKAQNRAVQEERRRIRDENRENERRRKIATRRQIIIGGIMTKHFPGVLNLQPQLKQADTDIEFAGLERFVSLLAADSKFSHLFQEMIVENNLGENRLK